MGGKLTLSVVDQSPVRQDGTAADALRETIALAVATEKLGYKRFWVAEHHNLPGFAGTTPEIMIGQIAARTSTLRVGSGGVMLSHYSALKVAETFRVLESLYPGRIDLGIGRAPGSDPRTAAALAYPGGVRDISYFPEQVDDVIAYLADTLDPAHPFAGVHAGPTAETMPELWLLGSGVDSAHLAAERGLPFSYAHFFGIGVEYGPAIVESYRRHFRPSVYLFEPRVNIAVQVLCAETEEEAKRLASSRNLVRLRILTGRRGGVPPVTEALAYPYTPQELAYLAHFSRTTVDGDPQQVKQKLETIAELYQTLDLSLVTICYDFAARVRSYELIAEVCGIKS
ncbi:MAG TPA: LLM class flavin-dependent oxidoreductase [Candidatus Binatia bacterium]|nr:LLM class flavin-dependent oxidoreductase [Candidatus Binatia bacterium]